jgi:hypothetical protein
MTQHFDRTATTDMRQAPMTIDEYICKMGDITLNRFEGISDVGIALLVNACARDFHTARMDLRMEQLSHALMDIGDGLSRIADIMQQQEEETK